MASKTDIANMALGHLGQDVYITDFDSDQSKAARCARRWYDVARRELLSGRVFKWATRQADLSLVSDPDDQYNAEWYYAYQYPPNCLFFQRLVGDGRRTEAIQIPFDQINDDDERLILTDEDDAVGEYTHDVEATGIFPTRFISALAYKMAAYMAPTMTAGDATGLQQRVLLLERMAEQKAMEAALNENQAEEETQGPTERSRESW